MRVAFHHAAIHKRAGVTLVAIANDILLFCLLPPHLRPFPPGREAAAPAPAQVGFCDLIDHVLCCSVKQRSFQRGIAADGEIFADAGCVNLSAMLQNKPSLLLIKRNLILLGISDTVFFE